MQRIGATKSAKRPRKIVKRGIAHSFDFTPGPDGGSEYTVRGIPTRFWRKVRAKARREHVSVRSVMLHLLNTWIDQANDPAA